MVEAAGLEPGQELLEPTSGNTGISLALVAKLKGLKLTCVMPSNATPERRALLELYGARSSTRPGEEGSNGAVRVAQEIAARDDRYVMLFQYANEWNPRAHYEGTGAEIARDLERVDALVAGLGTGGTLMGTGERLREAFPGVQVVAAEPLPGDPVMGLRSLEDGYVPPILDVSKLDRKLLVSNDEAAAAARVLLDREGLFAGRLRGSRRPCRAPDRRGAARGLCRRRRARGRRLEVPLGDVLARRRDRRGGSLVVVPEAIRAELHEHAAAESPNECCGVLVFRDGVAERYVRGRNTLASPYRYELDVDPSVWFLEDDGYELAVFHSHPETAPIPSRTDRELAGPLVGQAVPDLRPEGAHAARVAGRPRRRGRDRAVVTSRPVYVTLNDPFMIDACGSQTNL